MKYLVVILGVCLIFAEYNRADSSSSDSDSDSDSSQEETTTTQPPPPPCPCQRIYLPVCTVGGDTYPNMCELECVTGPIQEEIDRRKAISGITELEQKLSQLAVEGDIPCYGNSGNSLGKK